MTETQRQPSPKAIQKLRIYEDIRQRLLKHFFQKQPLNVTNIEAGQAYSQIFFLMTSVQDKMQENNKYQSYDETYLFYFRMYLSSFCQRAKDLLKKSCNLSSIEYIGQVLDWVHNYTRFFHWTYKTFMAIERYSLQVKGTTLYFEGLTILKAQLIEPIYEDLLKAIFESLELYKSTHLSSISQMQEIIWIIGTVGLRKFKQVRLQKKGEKFVFVSKYQDNAMKNQTQEPESVFQTEYFKKNFIGRLISHLKEKYTKVSDELIKLSTPDYVQKALSIIQMEQLTADNFYPKPKVKSLVIRNLDEVLCHKKAQQLIRNPNSGLFSMLQKQDLSQAKNLLQLIKRSSNLKLFTKEYQLFIETKGDSILMNISTEDQKNPKKQTVTNIIDELYSLHEFMDRITSQVANNDTQIISAQTYGFQVICNKGDNKVCNFLAYYADNMLKKQEDSLNETSELTQKISKISKYLYSYDAFIKLYQKLLGYRMLFDNFKKKDAQLAIINLLKVRQDDIQNEAGISSLNKISSMVSDYMFSENFNHDKTNQFKLQLGFTLQVMILTSGSWQIQDSKTGKNFVPKQLIPAVQAFEKVYLHQLPDRTITWVFNYGRAIVLAHFDKNHKHVLILNNYQLCILLYLQRNGFKPAKIGDLLKEINAEDQNAFNASIMMLLKNKIIQKSGNPGKIESKNEVISYNYQFKSQSLKIRCFNLPKYIEKPSGQSGELVLERSHLIDAAIVKLMKSKRILQYQQLLLEVQKMIKTFKADTAMIKKRIQNCIERQFLERDPNEMNKLIYKP